MAVTEVERELRESVLEQLIWDNRVLSRDIQVDVHESKVTLHGHVPTSYSRLAAEEVALSVIGVTSVNNQLIVRHPEKSDIPKDSAIKRSIENMFEGDQRIDAEQIIVEVNAGTVILNGTVDAFWKKEVAEEYAHRVKGVVDVKNKLRIIPLTEIEDEKIRQDVKNALRRNKVTSDLIIEVTVHEGEVTLSGQVYDTLQRHTARDLSYFTSGVINVINKLKYG